jgi:predicted DNA repair protein MutK
VAGIVKLDDGGLKLTQAVGDSGWARFRRACGRGILRAAPWLMKFLSVAGTAAMFLVGGGILVHGVPALHHLLQPYISDGSWGATFTEMGANGVVGLLAGAVLVGVMTTISKLRQPAAPAAH